VLSKIKTINMPFGGLSIDTFVVYHHEPQDLLELNHALINLYESAIQPMNKIGVFHNDLKYSNILALHETENGTRGLKTRIIDWGLSFDVAQIKLPFLNHSSIPFNRPFTYVLLKKGFTKKYALFLKSLLPRTEPSVMEIQKFVSTFVQPMLDKEEGNLPFIESMLTKVSENRGSQWNLVFISFLVKSIQKFTSQGQFQIEKYVKEIYLPLLDTWGFLLSYWPVYKLYFKRAPKSKITTFFRNLFLHYLFAPQEIQPLDASELLKDLKKLNDYWSQAKQGGQTQTQTQTQTQKTTPQKQNPKTQRKTKKNQ
jgi:hypothetical protein